MDTSKPPADAPPPAEAAPVCAAAAAVHPPPTSSPPALNTVFVESSSGSSNPTHPPGSSSMPYAMGCCSNMAQAQGSFGEWAPPPINTIHEEHVPIPGQWISGNLWNLLLRPEVFEEAGPWGSLTRRTTTMASPNVPRYVSTGPFPEEFGRPVRRTHPCECDSSPEVPRDAWLRRSHPASMVKHDISADHNRT